MRRILMLAGVLLAGCAAVPPATQIVEVPVHVPCVKERPQRPEYEFDKLPEDASDGRKVMALARDWVRAQKYEVELEAVVAGCRWEEKEVRATGLQFRPGLMQDEMVV